MLLPLFCVFSDGDSGFSMSSLIKTPTKYFYKKKYQYEESTLRIRATVIARSSAHAGMVDGQIYWIETTATIADDYVYAGRYGIKYGSTVLNFYQTVSKERKR